MSTFSSITALSTFFVAAAIVMLSACSTPTEAPVSLASAQAPAKAEDASEGVITGSRLRRKTTDHLVRTTDAAGAKEMERARPPNPGPAFK